MMLQMTTTTYFCGEIRKYQYFSVEKAPYLELWQKKLVTVFSGKTDVPHPKFSVFLLLWSLKLGQGHQSNQFFVMSQLYIHENLIESSHSFTYHDIVQTRKRDANANADTSADANSICI